MSVQKSRRYLLLATLLPDYSPITDPVIMLAVKEKDQRSAHKHIYQLTLAEIKCKVYMCLL